MNQEASSPQFEVLERTRDPDAVVTSYDAYCRARALNLGMFMAGFSAWFGLTIANGDPAWWVGGLSAVVLIVWVVTVRRVIGFAKAPRSERLSRAEIEEQAFRAVRGREGKLGVISLLLSLVLAGFAVLGVVEWTKGDPDALGEAGRSIGLALIFSGLWSERLFRARFLDRLEALDSENPRSPPDASVGRALEA